MKPIAVTDSSFDAEVLRASGPVVVDFWAEWCGPCRMIAPFLEELATDMAGRVTVAKVNIDENPQTPMKYGVRGIPTMILFKGGQVAATKIGANVGLYTALSASIVRNHGRLYAFEGNPRVFESLQRTIVANELYLNPNVVAANVLVSSESGRGVLHYSANLPSGGTMSHIQLLGGKQHAVEVDMTTIDDFLPLDLAVDLVKIDVEGHEPMVLRGMEQTIARSPNIRIVTEFTDSLLAHTVNPADFTNYIRGLGFAICRVLPNFKIGLVPEG